MEFRYGGAGNGPPLPPLLPLLPQYWQPPLLPTPTGYSFFNEQAIRAGYWRPGFGFGNDYFCSGNGQAYEYYRQGFGRTNDCYSSNVAAIQREIEKERIREEIIREEIVRRELLVAEVRTEMRIERELALRLRGGGGFDRFLFPVGAGVGVEPRGIAFQQEAKGLSSEEIVAMHAQERSRMGARSETGGSEMPFLRRSVDSKIKEVTPSDARTQKEKIVFLTKPNVHLADAKRKVVSPGEERANETLSPTAVNKKVKEDWWTCAICQISSNGERALNDHFQGKKHKSREAALMAERNGINIGIGVLAKDADKPNEEVALALSSDQGLKLGGEVLQVNQREQSPLNILSTTNGLDNNNSLMLQDNEKTDKSKNKKWVEVQKSPKQQKKKKDFTFWCEMCKKGAHSEIVMENHRKGRKHLMKIQNATKNGQALPTLQIVGIQGENGADEASKVDDENLQNVDTVAKKEQTIHNLAGAKRKVVSPGEERPTRILSSNVANKKGKDDWWACAICQISANGELALNDHFQGKKHKSREAALMAERNGSNIRFCALPQNTDKPDEEVALALSSDQGLKLGEVLQLDQREQSPLDILSTKNGLYKNYIFMLQESEKADESTKEKLVEVQTSPKQQKNKEGFPFWCEMCEKGAHSEAGMENHRKGKKHLKKLLGLEKSSENGHSLPMLQIVGIRGENVADEASEVVEESLENVDPTANKELVKKGDATADVKEDDHETAKGNADLVSLE